MSISVHITGDEHLAQIQAHIERLSDAGEQLLNLIGAEVETQTHRRLRNEKTAPDGAPWLDWSERYAKTRHSNHSLLMSEGELDDSIQYYTNRNTVHVGSPLVYASLHQNGHNENVQISSHNRLINQAFGKALAHPVWQTVKSHSRHIQVPQREYLGLSDENSQDIQRLLFDFYGDLLR